MSKVGQWFRYGLVVLGIGLPSLGHAAYTRYEETHPAVVFQGNWQSVSGAAVSGGSVKAADAAGSDVTFTFRGTGVKFIGYECACTNGVARVYVDGTLRTSFNTWGESPRAQREMYSIIGLPDQVHTLRIEVTGIPRSGTGNTYIAVDAFDVQNGSAIPTYQETAPEITYTGNWQEFRDPSVSGGAVRASREPGATATFHFNGTGYNWIGYASPVAAGMAYVTIDGLENQSLVIHGGYDVTTAQPQLLMHEHGFAPGTHQVEIEVSGASTRGTEETAWVVIDAFRTLGGSSADTTAPTVTMTPSENAELSGVITISASASDNVGVTKVQFMWGDRILGEDTTAPYSLTRDMSAVTSDNSYGIKARAWDAAGNYDETRAVSITVRHMFERNPPTISILSPAEGATVSGLLDLEAVANDDSGVAAIYGHIDPQGDAAGSAVYSTPFPDTFNTHALVDGTHTLYARAQDIYGTYGPVDSATFTVDNSVQPGMRRIDDKSADIVYTGNWATYGGSNSDGTEMFHWNSARGSGTLGDTVVLTFEGTGVRWLGARCYLCGEASVSIDGGPPQIVSVSGGNDLYEPGNRGTTIYTSPTLPHGIHTLTITVVEEPPPSTRLVVVDAFEVLNN